MVSLLCVSTVGLPTPSVSSHMAPSTVSIQSRCSVKEEMIPWRVRISWAIEGDSWTHESKPCVVRAHSSAGTAKWELAVERDGR